MLGRRSRKLGHPRPAKVPEAIRERRALSSTERGAGEALGTGTELVEAARAGFVNKSGATTANASSQPLTIDENPSFTPEMLYYTSLSSNPFGKNSLSNLSDRYLDYHRERRRGVRNPHGNGRSVM